jgi:hypothetical protein
MPARSTSFQDVAAHTMLFSSTIAVLIGLALSGSLTSGTIMAQECPLSAPLLIKDMQSGFAGETGTVWTIAPDCSFTVARQIGFKTLDPDRQGRLTPEQQVQLKGMLDRLSPAAMPRQLGEAAQANARRITLSYGDKESVLTLAPGGGDLGALRSTARNDPASALLELADRIKHMTAGG